MATINRIVDVVVELGRPDYDLFSEEERNFCAAAGDYRDLVHKVLESNNMTPVRIENYGFKYICRVVDRSE